MSGAVISVLILLHFVSWLIQVMINQAGGGTQCLDISNFVCATPLDGMIDIAKESGSVGGFFGTAAFLVKSMGTFISSLIDLAFFDYGWLSGGGEIVDTMVLFIRLLLGGLFLGTLAKIALGAVAGKL